MDLTGHEHEVMHATLRFGKTLIQMSDGCPSERGQEMKRDGFRLAITLPDKEQVNRVFNAMAEGGTVDMPLEETFFSPWYGQVTDRFGVGWMLMVPGEPG